MYLELEQLRFRKNFEYQIAYDNVEGVKIPPMLIQPFVENAVRHGLMHKKGFKKVRVSFELGDALICVIEDNGIGRSAAKKIKDRQKSHQSFSVESIKTRFEILQEIYGGNLGITYEDLEENGRALGTRVVLTIPIKRIY